MKTNAELMKNLQIAIAEYSEALPSDESMHINIAFAKALYEYLEAGYCLTDLDWFKNTPYYTGACATNLPKAA